MSISIDDDKVYPLPNTNGRFIHLATLKKGVRLFIVFVDESTLSLYIEEITTGQLQVINNDELFMSLHKFAGEQGLLQRVRKNDNIKL